MRVASLLLTFAILGCSNDPQSSTPIVSPPASGSVFTYKTLRGDQSGLRKDTIMMSGSVFQGRSNVMLMKNEASMDVHIAYEPNGDISLWDGDQWRTRYFGTRQRKSVRDSIHDASIGYVIAQADTSYSNANVSIMNMQHQVVREEISYRHESRRTNGELIDSFEHTSHNIWIPALGMWALKYTGGSLLTLRSDSLVSYDCK
jgi:hypothetical protein